MGTHTKLMKWEYSLETNIAGGPAGDAYTYTAPANATELTEASLPYNEDNEMPFWEYKQEAVEAAGMDVAQKETITSGIIYKLGKIKQYMQNSIWLDLALGIAPAESGGGSVPKTFLLQWTNGLATYVSYGCYIRKYTLTGSPNGALVESIEIGHVKTEEEGTTFDDPWYIQPSGTPVANFEDVGSTEITIGGNTVTQLDSFELRVENTYNSEDPHASSYYHKYPFLSKRNVEIDVEFECDLHDEVWEKVFTTEAATLHTIVFTPIGKCNFQATNMKVKNDSYNGNVIPEKSVKKWKGSFEIGGNAVFTTP